MPGNEDKLACPRCGSYDHTSSRKFTLPVEVRNGRVTKDAEFRTYTCKTCKYRWNEQEPYYE